jgi:hypothetical protein
MDGWKRLFNVDSEILDSHTDLGNVRNFNAMILLSLINSHYIHHDLEII